MQEAIYMQLGTGSFMYSMKGPLDVLSGHSSQNALLKKTHEILIIRTNYVYGCSIGLNLTKVEGLGPSAHYTRMHTLPMHTRPNV